VVHLFELLRSVSRFMSVSSRLCRSAALMLGLAGLYAEAVPVIDPPPAFLTNGTASAFKVPVAKTLVVPVTATPDGNSYPLNFSVTSDNPDIMVRVRSGNPHMVIHVKYAGNTDAAFEGDLDFMLFRDLTPMTTGIIAGLAEGNYYLPKPNSDNTETRTVIFHRIVKDFVVQAGDPNSELQDPTEPVDSSGDPTVVLDRGPGFSYDDEYHPALIYSGYGQLAMANAGFASGTFRGTNGSQFFITTSASRFTDNPPKTLEYLHTIFGQLQRGYDILAKMNNVPVGPQSTQNTESSRPLTEVQITNSTVSTDYNDAYLVISAINTGTAHIMVNADDGHGGKAVPQTFQVTAQVDNMNSPPFLSPLGDHTVAKSTILKMPFKLVDLERDYATLSQSITNDQLAAFTQNPIAFSGLLSRSTVAILGNSGYKNTSVTPNTTGPFSGEVDLEVDATPFDMLYRGTIDGSGAATTYVTSTIAVGSPGVTPDPVVFFAAPNVATPAAEVFGRFSVASTRALPANIQATINWGDGTTSTGLNSAIPPQFAVTATPITSGVVSADPTHPSANHFQITSAAPHTYLREGIYPVIITLSDAAGANSTGLSIKFTSTAVVTSQAVQATGRTLSVTGKNTGKQTIATFTDTDLSPSTTYTATINWGDGTTSEGTVHATNTKGQYAVIGSHTYQDPESFAVSVLIHKAGGSDVSVWSRTEVRGFVGQQHLPPFDQAHLIAELTPVPLNPKKKTFKPTKTTFGDIDLGTSQTYFTYDLVILNNGNKASKAGRVRFYLSADETPNTSVSGTNPKDIELTIGPVPTRKSALLPPLQPGESFTYHLDKISGGDFRLTPPRNETGTGYNILANLDYSDPLIDLEPVSKTNVVGKINGVIVTPASIVTDEAGTPGTFKVRLDKPPGNDAQGNAATVTIPLKASVPAYANVSPASLTFTNSNWNQYQTVTVTGLPDSQTSNGFTYNPKNGPRSMSITVGPSTGTGLLSGISGPSVTVSNSDIGGNIAVSATSLQTTDPYGNGNTRTFFVSLVKAPTAPVTLQIHAQTPTTSSSSTNSSTLQQGLLSANNNPYSTSVTLTFNPADPAHPAIPPVLSQTVSVQGLADGTPTGTATSASAQYSITFDPSESDDPEFNNLEPATIAVTNQHLGNPIIVSQGTLNTTNFSPTGTFKVTLDKSPMANVILQLGVSSEAAGRVKFIPDPVNAPNTLADTLTLTFSTGASGNALSQTVNVRTTDPSSTFGCQVTIAPDTTTADTHFKNAKTSPVFVTNTFVPPISTDTDTVTTTDPRGTTNVTSFHVTLAQAPSGPVTLTLHAQPTADGKIEGTLMANGSTSTGSVTLTFNANTLSQTVVVTGQDDGLTSGSTDYSITFDPSVSSDPAFNNISVPAITATNQHFP